MKLDRFFTIIESKTQEGIEKLKGVEIGTEEYQLLVNQIISNINLRHDRDFLENGPQQGGGQEGQQQKQFDPQAVIGKEFK